MKELKELKEEMKLTIWWDIFIILIDCFPLGVNLYKGIQCFMNNDVPWGVLYIVVFTILGILWGILIYLVINLIKSLKRIEREENKQIK